MNPLRLLPTTPPGKALLALGLAMLLLGARHHHGLHLRQPPPPIWVMAHSWLLLLTGAAAALAAKPLETSSSALLATAVVGLATGSAGATAAFTYLYLLSTVDGGLMLAASAAIACAAIAVHRRRVATPSKHQPQQLCTITQDGKETLCEVDVVVDVVVVEEEEEGTGGGTVVPNLGVVVTPQPYSCMLTAATMEDAQHKLTFYWPDPKVQRYATYNNGHITNVVWQGHPTTATPFYSVRSSACTDRVVDSNGRGWVTDMAIVDPTEQNKIFLNSKLHYHPFLPSAWSKYEIPGNGNAASESVPGICSWGENSNGDHRLDVFFVGMNGYIYHNHSEAAYPSTNWQSGWTQVPHSFSFHSNGVTAAPLGNGSLAIFADGPQTSGNGTHGVWKCVYTASGGYGSWQWLGGSTDAAPTAVHLTTGFFGAEVLLFHIGASDHIFCMTLSPFSTSGWVDLGACTINHGGETGSVTYNPATTVSAAKFANGLVALAYVADETGQFDGVVSRVFDSSTGWKPWKYSGTSPV